MSLSMGATRRAVERCLSCSKHVNSKLIETAQAVLQRYAGKIEDAKPSKTPCWS